MYSLASFAALCSLLFSCALAQDTSFDEVKKAFSEYNIATDLNINFEPSVLLQVTFPQEEAPNVIVNAGIELLTTQTKHIPLYNLTGGELCGFKSNGPFVVISVDPDAPAELSQYRHFLGGDFNGQGDTTIKSSHVPYGEWVAPAPPPPQTHRYIFLLYTQPLGFNDNPEAINTPLTGFDVSSYAEKVGLGDPIGGTFMLVKAP